MKKTISIISILIICINFIYSTNSKIKLDGEVDNNPYTLKLKYNINDSYEEIKNSYDLFDGENRFNLNKNGRTSNFIVVLNGNENYLPNIRVNMGINPFVPLNYSSSINKPTDYVVVNRSNIIYTTPKAGFNDNFKVYEFYFYWTGNPNLTSGLYQSTIYIGYSVE